MKRCNIYEAIISFVKSGEMQEDWLFHQGYHDVVDSLENINN